MAGVILDTPAALALLRDEPGATKVPTVLSSARMSAVNHGELVSYYARAGADCAAVEGMLRALPIDLMPADRDLAVAAGLLRSVTAEAGLSRGDRFCLALATREGLVAMTADRARKNVAAACGEGDGHPLTVVPLHLLGADDRWVSVLASDGSG